MRQRDRSVSWIVLGLLASLCFVGQVWGHDFWLEPSLHRLATKQTLSVRWQIGMKFQGKPYKRKNSRIRAFVLRSPDGKRRSVLGREGADPAGAIVLQRAGAHMLLYRSHRAYIKLAPKKFERYLRHEGIGHIVKQRGVLGERKKAGTEWYSRCAKSLLVVGRAPLKDAAFARPAGLDFELVALENPFRLSLQKPLSIKAYYRGKALAGQVITAYHRQGKRLSVVKGRTNAQGIVRLPLGKSGRWLIKSIYMFRTPKGSKADWESLWTSLTLSRQGPHSAATQPAQPRASSRPASKSGAKKSRDKGR